jgi:hypothetical protein
VLAWLLPTVLGLIFSAGALSIAGPEAGFLGRIFLMGCPSKYSRELRERAVRPWENREAPV